MVKRTASMNTRLNIEKLDRNIVQKHGGSKQVGFKQLGLGVEIGVHGVHDEKCIWFEVELHGGQGDREAEVFQVTNDDTAVAHRRLKDKQPEEKTNTDCLVRSRKRNIRLGGRSRQSGQSNVLSAEDTTRSTYLVNRSPSSAIGFKKPIDMLEFFGWLASIKQGMNMGFNESGEYKKTFIGSGVARDRDQHLACELFGYREDSNEAAFTVAAVEKIYSHESLTFNNTVAYEMIWFFLADARLRSGLLRFYNEKLVQTLLEGHFILSLEGSLSGDYDVEKNDVGMLDKFDRGLQTAVQVFLDFDYAIGRSITYMEALLTTKAGYLTFTKAWKKEIWLKGLLTESKYELS
ncbi:hypothetical protein Tco_0150473 [Tanacetum coccineum]